MRLALNKAKTISWRLGVAWTLVSASGDILKCNGSIFNQHYQSLIDDVRSFGNAKKIYISYCPHIGDLNSTELIHILRRSKFVELHVHTHVNDNDKISDLSKSVAIPVTCWHSYHKNTTQSIGIEWVRNNHRPWVHVICSNSLGGGTYSLNKMSERLGVIPYVTLKGLESSLLYVQNDSNCEFGNRFDLANPMPVSTCQKLIQKLSESTNASVVTVVCELSWLALLVRISLANEVSYFLSLRSESTAISKNLSIVEFPENDQWIINSSEVKGDFMQVVLEKS